MTECSVKTRRYRIAYMKKIRICNQKKQKVQPAEKHIEEESGWARKHLNGSVNQTLQTEIRRNTGAKTTTMWMSSWSRYIIPALLAEIVYYIVETCSSRKHITSSYTSQLRRKTIMTGDLSIIQLSSHTCICDKILQPPCAGCWGGI